MGPEGIAGGQTLRLDGTARLGALDGLARAIGAGNELFGLSLPSPAS